MTRTDWKIAQPGLREVLEQFDAPLDELAAGNIPAIVLRGAWPQSDCRALIERLIAEDLLQDPHAPVKEKFLEAAIPEGYYREGRSSMPAVAGRAAGEQPGQRMRIDIGTSLGYRGSDPEEFFAHSEQTHQLFERLFSGGENPIDLLYQSLQELSRDRSVVTAHEPDGRRYGPAIIRAHYGGYTYRPHFDSVRLREKRSEYAVHEFEHQFAGVLVLQNSTAAGRSAQCTLHRCLWTPEVDPHLKAGTFPAYARERGIENVQVCLEPGDLYFFNTRSIHEVPGVPGELPRVVLATFIGYSPDRDEIFVWS